MDYDLIAIVSIIAVCAVVTAKILVSRGGVKKAPKGMTKGNEIAVMDHYNTLLAVNEDQKSLIKQFRGKIARMEQLEPDEDENEADPQEIIKSAMPMIQAAAKKYHIPPDKLQAMLNSPQVQEWISNPKNLKKLNEYLPLLATFTGTGSQSEQGGSVPSDYA